MTIEERRKQLRSYKFWTAWILFIIICWLPFLAKTIGCEHEVYPVAGASAYLINRSSYLASDTAIEEKEIEIVEETEIDLNCWKKYSAQRFKKLGRVKYGNMTNTWYSEKVLPGGGLDIPGRHTEEIDGLLFICDSSSYICVASDDYPKGTIVYTCVGRLGKVYDTGSGLGNIDLYVSW